MQKAIGLVLTGLLAALVGSAAPALMPMPSKVVPGAGALRIDGSFRVAFVAPPSGRLKRAGLRLVTQLSRQTGIPLPVGISRNTRHATLVIDCAAIADGPDKLGESEAYRLDVTPTQARLASATVPGVLRGIETFLQLVSPDETAFSAPSVRIEDAPRFPWRGLLIDVTSHFMPIPVIERNLDAMEAVKLNVFHWHLTDDQGFRIESKVFPKLYQLGSDGNYYTYGEIRHILSYARDRGIRVVPEIDMPGHCTSWLVGYPDLASAPGPYSIIHRFGVFDPALDPTREEVYQFLDRLIAEVAALFPDEYLHIGGDEVNGKQWRQSPAIQTFIRRHGLRDEAGLQAYFNRRVEALVRKHGKKMMGWDEVLHPDLPPDIVIQSWRDQESMAAAARAGHPVLLSFGYYLDHLDPAKAHYAVDPLGGPAKGLPPEAAARVLGGEACIWTEYVSPETIDSRIWPKTAAIAERLWSPASVNDPGSMYDRLDAISQWLDCRGVRHNVNYPMMLHRLSAQAPPGTLRILADTLNPLGIDGRETARHYTQQTPLNRLVDAARGDSVAVRRLERNIRDYLASGATSEEAAIPIRATLALWRDNDRLLAPGSRDSFLLNEATGLSRNLSALGSIGLQAMDYLRLRTPAPPSWIRDQLAALDRMEQPQAEVVLGATPPVRMLVRAAAKLEKN